MHKSSSKRRIKRQDLPPNTPNHLQIYNYNKSCRVKLEKTKSAIDTAKQAYILNDNHNRKQLLGRLPSLESKLASHRFPGVSPPRTSHGIRSQKSGYDDSFLPKMPSASRPETAGSSRVDHNIRRVTKSLLTYYQIMKSQQPKSSVDEHGFPKLSTKRRVVSNGPSQTDLIDQVTKCNRAYLAPTPPCYEGNHDTSYPGQDTFKDYIDRRVSFTYTHRKNKDSSGKLDLDKKYSADQLPTLPSPVTAVFLKHKSSSCLLTMNKPRYID